MGRRGDSLRPPIVVYAGRRYTDAGCGPIGARSPAQEPTVSFVIPESIDGYTREQLVAAEASAVEAFDALRDDENLNAEGLTQLRALATFIRTARERTAAIDAQSAADA